jgi:TolB protein
MALFRSDFWKKIFKKTQSRSLDNRTVILVITIILLILSNLIVLLFLVSPDRVKTSSFPLGIPTNQDLKNSTVLSTTSTPTTTLQPTQFARSQPSITNLLDGSSIRQGTVLFSMVENGYSHIFAFTPGDATLIRLTSGSWDDTTPSLSPDGSQLAFSSQRNGYWDIYILDMKSGEIIPVTDSGDYDSSPSWSPDGNRLVFQTYTNGNFELNIADLTKKPVEITNITLNDYNDFDPCWSPDGEDIVFISSYDNSPHLWIASVSDTQVQLEPVNVNAGQDPRHPAWSPNGIILSWSEMVDDRRTLVTWDTSTPSILPKALTEGDYPAWSPDGSVLFNIISRPNQSFLSGNSLPYGNLVYPVTSTLGRTEGLQWSRDNFQNPLPNWLVISQQQKLDALFQIVITPPPENIPNRYQVVPLPSVQAPYPMLHDLTDEAFQALRERLKAETGWDVLQNLESAFMPLSEVTDPGMDENWLYTGRGFSLNTVPMNINWMIITRESYGDQTFFHTYIRPLYQDGSMGKPVLHKIWNINARFSNDPTAYENGGVESISYPDGYWVDITDLTLRYGWERIEASPNWTTYYQGARFNLFVLRSGLSWKDAMLELYPVNIFITPTAQVQATLIQTSTPIPPKGKTPTALPNPTGTATRRPTWTPIP